MTRHQRRHAEDRLWAAIHAINALIRDPVTNERLPLNGQHPYVAEEDLLDILGQLVDSTRRSERRAAARVKRLAEHDARLARMRDLLDRPTTGDLTGRTPTYLPDPLRGAF